MAEFGWIAALQDQVLAPAMAQLHAAPERKWTVAELAGTVAVSRSVLDQRFRDVLGRSPIRYLTEWRMHLADDLLRTTELSVSTVARRVGYESEEAFSRAFDEATTSRRVRGEWRSGRVRVPLGKPSLIVVVQIAVEISAFPEHLRYVCVDAN
jgi:transcriptional regulator GlxA family with amidase domain